MTGLSKVLLSPYRYGYICPVSVFFVLYYFDIINIFGFLIIKISLIGEKQK